MTRSFKAFEDRTSALAALAQPVIVALSTAGVTGAAMTAAALLAGRVLRSSPSHH